MTKVFSITLLLSLYIITSDLNSAFANPGPIAAGSDFVCVLSERKVLCSDLSERHSDYKTGLLPPAKFDTVEGLSDRVTQIAAEANYACAIDDGHVRCWRVTREAYNNPPPLPRFVSAQLEFPAPVTHIAISNGVGTAISGDRVFTFDPKTSALPSPLSGIQGSLIQQAIGLTAGSGFRCINSSGQIYCQGGNNYGELGSAEFGVSYLPPQHGPVECLIGAFLSAGGGNPRCEGGYSLPAPMPSQTRFVLVRGLPKSKIVELASGINRSCAKGEDGSAYCWGQNIQSERCLDSTVILDISNQKQVSLPNHEFINTNCAARIERLDPFEHIVLGMSLGCGVERGKISCWDSSGGTLSDAPEEREPVLIDGVSPGVGNLAIGDDSSAYTLIHNTVWKVPLVGSYGEKPLPPQPLGRIGSSDKLAESPSSTETELDQNLRTPIYDAIERGDIEKIRSLVTKGADLENESLPLGETPLIDAIKSGVLPAFKILMEAGADPNHKARALYTNHNIFGLIEGELRVSPSPLDGVSGRKDTPGLSPLHYAIANGEITFVLALLDSRAKISSDNGMKLAPLHLAAWEGNKEIVKLLLNAGAEVDEVSRYGMTALHYAAFRGQTEIAKILLAKGADPKRKMNGGIDALMLASAGGYSKTAAYLRSVGLSPIATDENGMTALQYAKRGMASRVGGSSLEALLETLSQ